MMRNTIKLAVTCLCLALLGGCATTTAVRDPAYAPIRPVERDAAQAAAPAASAQGSIYRAGHEISLFEDQRARRVGDILTIRLVEKTDANKKAKTNTKKENDVSIANPTLFGKSPTFDLLTSHDNNLGFGLNSNQDFSGEGDSAQSNSLTGSVTVSVVEVLANGYLVVRGEKLLTINQGDEHIQVAGIVRPADIRADNTVLSTQVADAQITYAGKGQVADSNAAGWLARFFLSALWPF